MKIDGSQYTMWIAWVHYDFVAGKILVDSSMGGLILDLVASDQTFGFWGSLLVAFLGACVLVAILHAVTRDRSVV